MVLTMDPKGDDLAKDDVSQDWWYSLQPKGFDQLGYAAAAGAFGGNDHQKKRSSPASRIARGSFGGGHDGAERLLDPRRLVSIDEIRVKTDMRWIRGQFFRAVANSSPRGLRTPTSPPCATCRIGPS